MGTEPSPGPETQAETTEAASPSAVAAATEAAEALKSAKRPGRLAAVIGLGIGAAAMAGIGALLIGFTHGSGGGKND